MSEEKKLKPRSLFDEVHARVDRIVEDGNDPCVAAVEVSRVVTAALEIGLTPSECLLIWEMKTAEGMGR